MNPTEHLKLCYVEDGYCYFTPVELSKQWGDDWNDAPYSCNAGLPYNDGPSGGPKWTVYRMAYCRNTMETPDKRFDDARVFFSVQQINAGLIPWLADWYGCDPRRIVYAGASPEDVRRAVEADGGMCGALEVYR